jgi:hypothetical protein
VTSPAGDLSGEWRGIFNYPRGQPPTEFTATLHDAGGRLSGSTVEPSLSGGTIVARIDGSHVGSAVSFMKLYDDDPEDQYDTVAYEGAVDAEGTEIAGRWSIPGVWSGSFIMVRRPGVEAGIEASVAEPVR